MVSGEAPSWNPRITSSSRTLELPTRIAPVASFLSGGDSHSKTRLTILSPLGTTRAGFQSKVLILIIPTNPVSLRYTENFWIKLPKLYVLTAKAVAIILD